MVQRVEQDSSSLLSPREHQLLVLAAQGFTDQGIAHKLGISLATVGTYWGRIRIKMGPLNRTELVAHFLTEEAAHEVDALRSENERLISELDERAKTTAMLKASLELFRGLVETAPDAIVLVNERGVIELANEQAETMFGYGPNELLGLPVSQLIPVRYREKHDHHRDEYHANPTKKRMGEHLATLALRKDGTEFAMATALSATRTPNGVLVTCIVRDLSERMNERVLARVGAEPEA
jgi:PAS domain S-box-containing protein